MLNTQKSADWANEKRTSPQVRNFKMEISFQRRLQWDSTSARWALTLADLSLLSNVTQSVQSCPRHSTNALQCPWTLDLGPRSSLFCWYFASRDKFWIWFCCTLCEFRRYLFRPPMTIWRVMMILSCISYLLCSQKIVNWKKWKQTMSHVDSDDNCLTCLDCDHSHSIFPWTWNTQSGFVQWVC